MDSKEREVAAIAQLVDAHGEQRLQQLCISQNELARGFASEREALQRHAALQRVVAELGALEPEGIWLFGSRAECRAQPTSDWDVLVVVDKEVPWEVTRQLRDASGLYVEVHAWTAAHFEVDRFIVGTCASSAWRRGIDLRPARAWGVAPSDEALSAARDRWVRGYLDQANMMFAAQKVLWDNGLDVRRRAYLELGIELETEQAWIAKWLVRALLVKRAIDPVAARTVGDLVALLGPADQELLRPLLLEDDDDDAIGDPEVITAVTAAVAAVVTRL